MGSIIKIRINGIRYQMALASFIPCDHPTSVHEITIERDAVKLRQEIPGCQASTEPRGPVL